MPTPSEAEEHLRVIRSLMERATVYRAISAPAAAIGGFLAIVASFAFGNWLETPGALLLALPRSTLFLAGGFAQNPAGPVAVNSAHIVFCGLWMLVVLAAAAVNFGSLWLDSRRRGAPFASAGMRMALRALLPSYLFAAYWTWLVSGGRFAPLAAPIWIVCHGLALLATAHFAPRSLIYLGWSFLIAGFASIAPIASAVLSPFSAGLTSLREIDYGIPVAQAWMAMTFGALHLIYAACVLIRKPRASETAVAGIA